MIQADGLQRWLLAAVLALALGTPQLVSAQGGQGIIVFGTSLSDSGNALVLLGEATTPPDWSVDQFLVPDQPYARGGHHFSNGATWIEQLARPLGLAASVKPAFGPSDGTNFAVGGARAREFGESPTLSMQVGIFLQATGGKAPDKALYVIEMGGNDMRDALEAFATGHDGSAILEEALKAIGGNLNALYAAGARRFLVWNMPNLGITPAIASIPPLASLADLLAQGFNKNLELLVLDPLRGAPGVELALVDVYRKLNMVVDSPATFGIDNVKQACISVDAPFSCAQPNDYLFWDGIHPTAAGHAIIAHEAAHALRQ